MKCAQTVLGWLGVTVWVGLAGSCNTAREQRQPAWLDVAPKSARQAQSYLGRFVQSDSRLDGLVSVSGPKIGAFVVAEDIEPYECTGLLQEVGAADAEISTLLDIRGVLTKVVRDCAADMALAVDTARHWTFGCGERGAILEAGPGQVMQLSRCCTADGAVKELPGCAPDRRVITRIAQGELDVGAGWQAKLGPQVNCVVDKLGKLGLSLQIKEGRNTWLRSSGWAFVASKALGEVCAEFRGGCGSAGQPPCGPPDEVECARGLSAQPTEHGQRCLPCGSAGQVPCPTTLCEPGQVAHGGVCQTCGGLGELPCLAGLQCRGPWRTVRAGKCRQCGARGQASCPGQPPCQPQLRALGGRCCAAQTESVSDVIRQLGVRQCSEAALRSAAQRACNLRAQGAGAAKGSVSNLQSDIRAREGEGRLPSCRMEGTFECSYSVWRCREGSP